MKSKYISTSVLSHGVSKYKKVIYFCRKLSLKKRIHYVQKVPFLNGFKYTYEHKKFKKPKTV